MKRVSIERRAPGSEQLPIFSQVPHALARIYASRGVQSQAELGRNLKELLPDSEMKGMNEAVARLTHAVVSNESMLIVGDFDCDGATSTAVAVLGLRMMGATQVDYLVPNRFEYGYGLSPEIVEVAHTQSPSLLITVDNGISSVEGVARARSLGMDVVVTDHHLAGDQLPDAAAIVNPNQPGCGFPAKSTCGVGVIFYVLIALRRALQQQGWFEQQDLAVPNLASLLDLVALGTVADVVALEHNNRVLVHQGLKRIRAGQARPGLLALIEISGRQKERLVASDLGFAIAPRLNAAGRLEDMSIGIECLLSDDADYARDLAQSLDQLNLERRGIEQEMQQQALQLLDQIPLDENQLPYGLCLYDEAWHQGVVGILASRIKERTHRPVIAFARGDNGDIKGSARSIPGLHIRDALATLNARHPDLISKFGGHAMAAGLTLNSGALDQFKVAFDQAVREQLSADDLDQRIETDGELSASEMSLELAERLREAGPWGHHFPEPLFDGQFSVLQQRIVGQRHLKLVLMDAKTGISVDAIHFNADMDCWPDQAIVSVRAVYKLDVNEFRGQRNVQLMVDYIEPLERTGE
ncbi:single-stranded-DNA-specific exonuclease RecJ [Neptunomonas phycophila]|uniref:Single-stranded-DNA-specific exonuclease RecJ n=1 Tax=Neptunomonas phycophila TaxID=1572645 RepID=A0AAW7XJC4_9GAMM|nr:single-stranded-DNA-specific exonuclease RecJ [Neptunomonas phycophila]MDO6453811.1 single-stranded-DNA-specific exonuclease RecJ [Neptunomonas phycophila]